jgi:membrane protease YdiL (CAAX protease family)
MPVVIIRVHHIPQIQGKSQSQFGANMQKFIGFPLVRIILAILLVGIGLVATQLIINLLGRVFPADNPIAGIGFTVLALLAVYYAYYSYVHLMEKRPITELSGPGALNELALGLLIGFGLFSMIIAVLWALGYYRVTGMNGWSVIIPAIVANVPSGFVQEIIFRGAIFRITRDWLGVWWALGISSILFGLIHILSATATVQSVIAITLEAGVLLAAAYLLTNRLWLPIGIHVAWDLANDGIFGAGSSGASGESIRGLLQANLTGPALVSGGSAGVEASVIAVIVTLAASIYMIGIAQKETK